MSQLQRTGVIAALLVVVLLAGCTFADRAPYCGDPRAGSSYVEVTKSQGEAREIAFVLSERGWENITVGKTHDNYDWFVTATCPKVPA